MDHEPTRRVWRHFNYSNVMSTLAVFLVVAGGTALAATVNSSKDIKAQSVKNSDVKKNTLTSSRLKDDKAVKSVDVIDESLGATDLGSGSVGSDELIEESVTAGDIAADSVGSSELVSGVVGADELDTVHEHVSATTTITDTTAHDGAYGLANRSVTCGVGEDLLSVSIDWLDDNGHTERALSGVSQINRGGDDTVTVEAIFDGGGGAANPATFQAVATCIF